MPGAVLSTRKLFSDGRTYCSLLFLHQWVFFSYFSYYRAHCNKSACVYTLYCSVACVYATFLEVTSLGQRVGTASILRDYFSRAS